MANTVKFYAATQAQYDAATKDENALYIITDSGAIYKGSINVTTDTSLLSVAPENLVKDNIAIVKTTIDEKDMYDIYVGDAAGKAVKAQPGSVSHVGAFADGADGVDKFGGYVPTVAAIKSWVETKIGAVSGSLEDAFVDAELADGKITLSRAKGSDAKEISLTGYAHDITWDSSTLTLTVPQIGEENDLVVNIPKDMFVQSGEYVADYNFAAEGEEEDKQPAIVLTINTTDGTETTQSIVAIPAASLVDTYTGDATKTVSVSISDGNVVTASLVFDTETTLDTEEKIIVRTADGIAVAAKSIKDIMDDVDTAIGDAIDEFSSNLLGSGEAGKVVVSTADGIDRSGAAIGGASLAATPDASTLATEKAVETAVESAITWNTLASE